MRPPLWRNSTKNLRLSLRKSPGIPGPPRAPHTPPPPAPPPLSRKRQAMQDPNWSGLFDLHVVQDARNSEKDDLIANLRSVIQGLEDRLADMTHSMDGMQQTLQDQATLIASLVKGPGPAAPDQSFLHRESPPAPGTPTPSKKG